MMRMSLPDLDSLRCFEAAAVHQNFRVASGTVRLSPAAFSDRIARLEEILGARLFERTTRKVALTPAGSRLLPQARRCLEEARRCLDVVREDGRRAPFSIVLGTRHELGMSWLLPSLDLLREHRPERSLNLYFGSGPHLLETVERGVVDAMVASVRLTHGGLSYANLHTEEYVLVGAPDLLGELPLKTAPDASHHVLLDIAPPLPLFRYLLDALDRPEAWIFRRSEYLGTIAAVRARALAGAGVAVLPRYFVAPDLRDGTLVEAMPGTEPRTDSFRLVWRASDPREEEFQALAEELRQIPLK